MRTGIAFLASIVLSANATVARAQYTVDGLALGTRLNFDSASYRETLFVSYSSPSHLLVAEQTIIAEKADLEAKMAQLEADRAAGNAQSNRWESTLYGAFGGLLVVLMAFAIGLLINRRKESISEDQVCGPGTNPLDVSGQAQHREVEIIPHSLPPEIASAEAVLQRELERQVAAINATQDVGEPQNVSALPTPDVDADGLRKAIDGPRARERVQAEEI
jgi:hypothetical protein